MDTTPSPAIHNPAYDTNWTPRNEPSNATPMPLAIVTASPTLLWLLGCPRFRFRTNKIEEWSWFYKITYAANLIPLNFFGWAPTCLVLLTLCFPILQPLVVAF